MKSRGNLIVISGPSGAGKSTIIKALMQKMDNLAYSISHTTRKPRKGEKNGVDYYFVDEDTFYRMIKNGEFIEWAKVYTDLYGTSFSSVRNKLNEGKDVLLDLDVQGSMNIRKHFKNSILIFLIPPSLEELERRLKKRGTEESIIRERLTKAMDEIRMAREYDYVVINEMLDKAIKEVESIIISERCRTSRRLSHISSLFGI